VIRRLITRDTDFCQQGIEKLSSRFDATIVAGTIWGGGGCRRIEVQCSSVQEN
jgi:hypothetical protein